MSIAPKRRTRTRVIPLADDGLLGGAILETVESLRPPNDGPTPLPSPAKAPRRTLKERLADEVADIQARRAKEDARHAAVIAELDSELAQYRDVVSPPNRDVRPGGTWSLTEAERKTLEPLRADFEPKAE